MKKRKITTAGGILGIVVVAALGVLDITGRRAGAESQATGKSVSQPASAEKANSVEVAQPVRRVMSRSLEMPASLMADEHVDLYAKTSGYISHVGVDIGSAVKKGETLLTIDVPEMADELRQAKAVLAAKGANVRAFEAKARQAVLSIEAARAGLSRYEANLHLEKITLERKQKLREGNAIPLQALDDAQNRLEVAEAQIRIANAAVASAQGEKIAADADVKVAESEVAVAQAKVARLETLMNYASIRAPFTGIVTERLVDTGTFVRSAEGGTSSPLLRVAKVDKVRVVLGIPESDAGFVRVGTAVEVHIKALGGKPIEAKVDRIAGALDPQTRTMRAEVDLDNKAGRLSPGMYVKTIVKLEAKGQAMMIPSKAIRVRGRETSVFVAADHVARSVSVKIGYDDGIWAEIVSGLRGDEWIIVSATSTVAPGAPIIPVPVGKPGA